MITAIIAPAGLRSIAMMRACLVSGRVAALDDASAGRLREAGLAAFLAVDRLAAFGLDFGLVMGSSEVYAAPSAAPPQPHSTSPLSVLNSPEQGPNVRSALRGPTTSDERSQGVIPLVIDRRFPSPLYR
jgi:hypothetical protein